MRLLIDLQGAQSDSRFRGIGRYVNALVSHMLSGKPQGHEVHILLNGNLAEGEAAVRAHFQDSLEGRQIKVWFPCVPASWDLPQNDGRRLASEKIRESVIAALDPDLLLVSSLFEGCGDNVVTSIGGSSRHIPTAVIFYDLIPLLYADTYLTNDRLRGWYEEKIGHAKRADALLAISESTSKDALTVLNTPATKVANISSGVDTAFKAGPHASWPALSKRFGIDRPYLFYSGAADQRKNLTGLLEAFASIAPTITRNFQLVFSGPMTNSQRKQLALLARRLSRGRKRLIVTGHVSDEELRALYCHAHGFVFPSIYEGFGLPPLEAMACGIPVIASNTSALPEVVGVPEALFDPLSRNDMARALERLMTDSAFRARLLEQQGPRVAMFSWEAAASRAWQALEALHRESAPKRSALKPQNPDTIRQRLITEIGSLFAQHGVTARDYIVAAEAIDRSFRSLQ